MSRWTGATTRRCRPPSCTDRCATRSMVRRHHICSVCRVNCDTMRQFYSAWCRAPVSSQSCASACAYHRCHSHRSPNVVRDVRLGRGRALDVGHHHRQLLAHPRRPPAALVGRPGHRQHHRVICEQVRICRRHRRQCVRASTHSFTLHLNALASVAGTMATS